MILTFKPLKMRPAHWLDTAADRPASPFSSTYNATLQVLDTELFQLGATDVSLQVVTSDQQIRLDGQLRVDARVEHPGVILTIETPSHGVLVYETDRYGKRWGSGANPAWQENLRAIALGLEALRKVERYGIARRGQQYAGYRELGSGTPMPAAQMTIEQAACLLIENAGTSDVTLEDLENTAAVHHLFRTVAKHHHPDAGGDTAFFMTLVEARDLLIGDR